MLAALVDRWLRHDAAIDDAEMLTLLRVPNFLEDVALMVEAGNLDPDLVARTIEGPVLREWDFWELAVRRIREDDDGAYTQFEELAQELAKRATTRRGRR